MGVLRKMGKWLLRERKEGGNWSVRENGKVVTERKERGWKLECKGKWESGY